MSEDKRIKKYFENMPYGDDAKSSEIHGKHNQVIINRFISDLVKQYDALWASGDKENAQHIDGAIKDIARQLDNLSEIKKEFAVNYGGGVGGKKIFSNFTDLTFDRAFFTEQGNIGFDNQMNLVLSINNIIIWLKTNKLKSILKTCFMVRIQNLLKYMVRKIKLL